MAFVLVVAGVGAAAVTAMTSVTPVTSLTPVASVSSRIAMARVGVPLVADPGSVTGVRIVAGVGIGVGTGVVRGVVGIGPVGVPGIGHGRSGPEDRMEGWTVRSGTGFRARPPW
ncbi:MAG TPA: hypothetical protein VK858_11900 [Longimicrobiales bacterium]|nr:hypothetical protein [Longimicrobiales bacterium]